jgi:hypothetical protein
MLSLKTSPDMDSSSSTTSDHNPSDSLSPSTAPTTASTPLNPSLVDLPKLSRDAAAAGEALNQPPVNIAKNICCVGAGYVGMSNIQATGTQFYLLFLAILSFCRLETYYYTAQAVLEAYFKLMFNRRTNCSSYCIPKSQHQSDGCG